MPDVAVIIDSNRIKLSPESDVNYILTWGNLDPQQVALSKVVIKLDVTNTGFSVVLPPLSQEQSQNVELYFSIVGLGGGSVNIQAGSEDIIARQPNPITMSNGGITTVFLFWLIDNNWNYSNVIG